MEKTYKEIEVTEMIKAAIEEYKKEQNIEEMKANLETEMAAVNKMKGELEDAKKDLEKNISAFDSSKKEFEASKSELISKEDHEVKIKEAIEMAIANLEKFYLRVAKLSEMGIELDESGVEKIKKADDDTFEWLCTTLKKASLEKGTPDLIDKKEEKSGDKKENLEADVKIGGKIVASMEINETPPTGILMANDDFGKSAETIGKILGKTIASVR